VLEVREVVRAPVLPDERDRTAREIDGVPDTGNYEVSKSEDEWREQLTSEQFYVCRQKGTERPYSGQYATSKSHGVYNCTCCGQTLFRSSEKFDSGTGWPSYYDKATPQAIVNRVDRSMPFMPRTEVLCSRCGAHLGHVFTDGPRPTGLRYCINSVCLMFQKT